MSEDFGVGERVLCISDLCPKCSDDNNAAFPEVGEIYEVKEIDIGQCTKCHVDLPVIIFEAHSCEFVWPQACFKRIPPKITEVTRRIEKPELIDA